MTTMATKADARKAIRGALAVLDGDEYDSNDEEIGDLRDNLDNVVGVLADFAGIDLTR